MKANIEISSSLLRNMSARFQDSTLARGSVSNSAASSQNTISSEGQALKAIGIDDVKKVESIKALVKDVDFTSITQRELSTLSVELYDRGVITLDTASKLALGDASFREDGSQITDQKFNALEHFSKDFNNQKEWASRARGVEGIYNAKAEVAKTQNAVGVLFSLSYFSGSEDPSIGVDVKA